MSLATRLLCTRCGKEFGLDREVRSCPSCAGTLWVDYEFSEFKEARGKDAFGGWGFGIWRYHALLPVLSSSCIVSLGEGWTFLHRSEGLARELGLKDLYIKNETTNPTGSFIDRGVSVEASKAREFGHKAVACATTGNLGASVAAYAAKAGLKCKVAIPSRIDLGKLYQIIAYGAEAEPTRDYEEALLKAEALGDGCHVITPGNPYLLEGLKTTAYEICEQLGWVSPDWIVVPMGNGSHLSMIWKGLNELVQAGILDSVRTRLVGVQAEGAAPIVRAYDRKEQEVTPVEKARTVAVDICIKRPLTGYLAIRALRESKGKAVAIPDKAIMEATSLLSKREGIFAEPAASSTIAALKLLANAGIVDRKDKIVCVITGTGLKDPITARRLIERSKGIGRLLKASLERRFTVKLTGTKLEMLRLISRREMYGYEIARELRHRANIDVKLPTVYQHLLELERMGLIEMSKAHKPVGGRERHYYALTNRGRALLRL